MDKYIPKINNYTLGLPRYAKILIAVVTDVSLCVLTIWLAFYIRLDEFVKLSNEALIAVALSAITAITIFFAFGLYREIFRYSGLNALFTVFKAIIIYGLIFVSVVTAVGIDGVPRTIGLIQPFLLFLFVGLSRVSVMLWLGNNYQFRRRNRTRILIYGVGTTGRQLASAIENSIEMKVVGFLDDDERLHGQSLNGLMIYNPSKLMKLVTSLQISDVYLAMPKVSRKRRNAILNRIKEAKVSVRTLPSITDLAQGKITVSDLRELDTEDLLGREPVKPNLILLSRLITKKAVMVTGAGGSIGSELCRQIILLGPEKMLLVEQSESALYEIHKELENKNLDVPLVPLIASVQDRLRMNEVMSDWKPNTVYHAAAYKHVPLVERNILEGVKNNVIGTLVTVQTAIEHGAENFVLISTDKAVRPTNVMGASKRLAELLLQAHAGEKGLTNLSIVRFGNVLDSSGSVVPRFREQIKAGGPITLTHEAITRFFMTIPEAAQLVIQAGAIAKTGDIFVLDMGEPVKIIDLAKRMIKLSGLTVKDSKHPDGDIEIDIIGLRPGEKLYEELLIGEVALPTIHPRIIRAQEDFLPWQVLQKHMIELKNAIELNDTDTIRSILVKLVAGYSPSDPSVISVPLKKS